MKLIPNYSQISVDLITKLYDADPIARVLIHQYLMNPIHQFVPRTDDVSEWDQQDSFVNATADFSICLGGTGSGKTVAAAYKTACKVLFDPPPERDAPFWIIGETFDLVCGVCWKQKLRHFIPPSFIQKITWINKSRGWPASILLKHPTNPTKSGWELVFRSFAMGREKFQSYAIGGYWFNEECPIDIVYEVQGRTRESNVRGWADFTPLSVRSFDWKNLYENPPPGWEFFHLNTRRNHFLAKGWADKYLATIPDDMRATRETGAFGNLRGLIFKEWRRSLHVLDPSNSEDRKLFPWLDARANEFGIPEDWLHFRGLDFGYNNPFACVWLAMNSEGTYFVYDEYYRRQELLETHANALAERRWLDQDSCWRTAYADPAAAQDRQELIRLGIKNRPAKNNVIEGIEAVRRKMKILKNGKAQFYVLSHCKNVIREIEQYHWDLPQGTGLRQKNARERPVTKDDHTLDAIRYVIYTEEAQSNTTMPKGIRNPEASSWRKCAKSFFG